jgi:xylose isomerase
MNNKKHQYSVILNNYLKPSDRFMVGGYGDPAKNLGVYDLIDLAGSQGILDGLEMIFDANDVGGDWIGIGQESKAKIKAALDKNNLKLVSIIPDFWGHWRQAKGTLGSTDPKIRRETIDMCKRAADVAADVGCPYLGFWPGQDGFDYYFEVDYQQQWDWWVKGMQEIADHNPNIKIGLEPKPEEPRAFSLISTVPKAMLLINDIDRDNVGVCLDIGHSLYSHENLGEVVALMQAHGNKLFHCHMNDNYNASDLDMIFGSVHTLEFIEFFYWLRRTGYSGAMSIDLFAYRTDPALSVVEGVKWMQAFDRFIDKVGLDKLTELINTGDPVESTRFFREQMFGG